MVLPLLLSMLLFQPFTRYPVTANFGLNAYLRAGAKVEVWNGQSKKHAARIIPVVLGLDHFRASRRDKFSNVDLQPLAQGARYSRYPSLRY